MRFVGYAMIIGAMKSGTTSLHHIINQHPEITAGRRKELNYFRGGASPDSASYELEFPHLDKDKHVYTLDSSPNYTKSDRWAAAPARISQLPGQKKLIYILRNPLERIDSQIAHNIAQGRWTAENWLLRHVIDVSSYAKHIARYENAGLLDDMLLLDFAELCADPVDVSYRVQDFLGICRIQPKSVRARNIRKIDARFIQPAKAEEIKVHLKRDVAELITRYGFESAKSWEIV